MYSISPRKYSVCVPRYQPSELWVSNSICSGYTTQNTHRTPQYTIRTPSTTNTYSSSLGIRRIRASSCPLKISRLPLSPSSSLSSSSHRNQHAAPRCQHLAHDQQLFPFHLPPPRPHGFGNFGFSLRALNGDHRKCADMSVDARVLEAEESEPSAESSPVPAAIPSQATVLPPLEPRLTLTELIVIDPEVGFRIDPTMSFTWDWFNASTRHRVVGIQAQSIADFIAEIRRSAIPRFERPFARRSRETGFSRTILGAGGYLGVGAFD